MSDLEHNITEDEPRTIAEALKQLYFNYSLMNSPKQAEAVALKHIKRLHKAELGRQEAAVRKERINLIKRHLAIYTDISSRMDRTGATDSPQQQALERIIADLNSRLKELTEAALQAPGTAGGTDSDG